MLTVVNRHETETISWSGDLLQAETDLVTYLRRVASADYSDRVLAWWHSDREQPFITNNTTDATPDTDPNADTWTWEAISRTPPQTP